MADKITLQELSQRLRNIPANRRALEIAASEVTEIAVQDVKDRMSQGLQPDGTEQPPLKNPRPSGNTGPPLVDYGYLQGSVTAEVNGGILRLTARRAGARKNQRERPFLGLSKRAIKQIRAVIYRQVLKVLKGES